MVVYRTRLEPFSRFLYSLIINTAFFFVLKFIPSRSPKSFSFPVGYDGTDVSVDAAIDLAMAKGMSRLFTNTLIAGLPTLLLLWAQTQLFVPDFWFLNAAFASLLTTGDLVTWWTVLLKFVFTVPRPTFLAVCQPSKEEIARQWSLLSTEQQSKHRFQVNLDVCASTVASSALRDQLSGFPSGTIAAVFGASTISILLIHTVLKPFTTERTSPVRLFAMTSPLLVAAWITADRLHQNATTVPIACFSAVLGVLCALLAYKAEFHSLFNNDSNHLYYEDGIMDDDDEIQDSSDEDMVRKVKKGKNGKKVKRAKTEAEKREEFLIFQTDAVAQSNKWLEVNSAPTC